MRRRAFLMAAAGTALARPSRAARVAQGLFVHDSPRPVPPLDIRDNRGQPAGFDSFRGRPALVNLWASWCLPCVAELPALDRLKPRIEAEGGRVVALCLDRSGAASAVNTFARLGIVNLEIHVDFERKAGEVLAVPVLPVSLLLNARGDEVARFVGPAEWDGPQALALMRALIAGHPLTPEMAPPLVKPTAAP
jgi:thiol-disulfide isomerase/thioredoxin